MNRISDRAIKYYFGVGFSVAVIKNIIEIKSVIKNPSNK
jgi:hypothetical protein